MASQPPFIPASDAGFASWSANFEAIMAVDFAAYGLTSGQATAYTASDTAWQSAYATAVNPATRTKPAVAAKDSQRVATEALARQYAAIIRANPAVTDMMRLDAGLNLPTLAPTPVPAPVTSPIISIRNLVPNAANLDYRDSENPDPKAKPEGVVSAEIVAAIGVAPAVSPTAGSTVALQTRTPFQLGFSPDDSGSVVTLFSRWVTRSGPGGSAQKGPWAMPVSFTLP